MNCLIYRTIITPDVMLFSIYGPTFGRRHEVTPLNESGIEEKLDNLLHIDGRQLYLYGDAAYMPISWMQVPFTAAGGTLYHCVVYFVFN